MQKRLLGGWAAGQLDGFLRFADLMAAKPSSRLAVKPPSITKEFFYG